MILVCWKNCIILLSNQIKSAGRKKSEDLAHRYANCHRYAKCTPKHQSSANTTPTAHQKNSQAPPASPTPTTHQSTSQALSTHTFYPRTKMTRHDTERRDREKNILAKWHPKSGGKCTRRRKTPNRERERERERGERGQWETHQTGRAWEEAKTRTQNEENAGEDSQTEEEKRRTTAESASTFKKSPSENPQMRLNSSRNVPID